MTAVSCPLCVLRFATKNERDWHLRNEHQHPHVHPPADRPVVWPRRTAAVAEDQHQPENEHDAGRTEVLGG